MQRQFAGFEQTGRHSQSSLGLDAPGDRPQHARTKRRLTGPLAGLPQRKQRRQERRKRMIWRIPHRFEVEHMHRCTVDTRGLDDAGRESLADHARRAIGTLAVCQRRQDAGTGFVGTCNRNGETVEQQKAALLQQQRIVRRPSRQDFHKPSRYRLRVNPYRLHCVFLPHSLALIAPLAGIAQAQPAAPTPEQWSAVVDAAKKEGMLTFYHNTRPQGIEKLLSEFRKDYPGIKTEHIRLGSAGLNERFGTEYTAGRNLADVLVTFPDEVLFKGVDQNGWALEWTPPELAAFPPEVNRNNRMFALHTTRNVIIYNKQRVKPADAPKEWDDLWNPKFKGKAAMDPPWRSNAVQGLMVLWAEKAPHPNAAKVFANWLMTAKGQALLQETDGLPVTRPGVPPPKFIPPTSALSNVIDTTKNSYGVDLNKEINTWRETFGIK